MVHEKLLSNKLRAFGSSTTKFAFKNRKQDCELEKDHEAMNGCHVINERVDTDGYLTEELLSILGQSQSLFYSHKHQTRSICVIVSRSDAALKSSLCSAARCLQIFVDVFYITRDITSRIRFNEF